MLEIESYENASDIPEKYLPSLVEAEIECWGSKPFDEYKICKEPNCRALYSIEDIYGSIEKYRNREEDKEFNCECGGKTELFYKPDEFLELIKEYVKKNISAVLFIVEEEVEGFGIITKTTLGKLINLEFASRPGSYDKEKLLYELSEEIFGVENAEYEEVVVLHQIFISEFIRGGGNGKKILEALLKINPNKNLPFLLETRYDSKFYPISRTMGFKNIVHDTYGYILQYNKEKSFINLENIERIFDYISNNFDFYEKEALEISNSSINFQKRKRYA